MTANIGGIDEVNPPVKQSAGYDFYYYTENNLPFPLPNLNNRMKGKYFKTQAHKFLDHDIFIWIDGSIEITSVDFVKTCVKLLERNDIVMAEHGERKNAYEELLYIIEGMKKGSPYLLRRYAKQPLYAEFKYYKEAGMPKDVPLYFCSFFARKNSESVNIMFDDWFDHTLRFSNLDQAAFSFAQWRANLNIGIIDTSKLFIRHKHQ